MFAKRTFSTEHAPLEHRANLFQQQMATLFSVGLSVQATSTDRSLHTTMTCYPGSRLTFAALRFSPHTTTAAQVPRRTEARNRPARMLVSLHREGTAVVAQDGRQNQVMPGDFFLLDPSRPFLISAGEVLAHSVYVLPSALRELVPNLDALTAIPIRGSAGPGALFRALLDEVATLAPVMTETLADAIADAVPSVLAAALRAVPEPDDLPLSRQKMVLLHRIRRFVREHLGDPALDGEMIAMGVSLSPRYVYDLFKDEPKTLMKWVWDERLERCHRDLSLPSLFSRSVGEIAMSWGFNDQAHFSRAFKQAYGLSPRAHRSKLMQS